MKQVERLMLEHARYEGPRVIDSEKRKWFLFFFYPFEPDTGMFDGLVLAVSR